MLKNNITKDLPLQDQISMTETAAEFFTKEFSQHDLRGFGVRMKIVRGDCNCNDYSYQMEYTNEAVESDMIFLSQGHSIICDPGSFPFLKGLVLDFSVDENSGGLRLLNPNAKKSCGCGTSFSV